MNRRRKRLTVITGKEDVELRHLKAKGSGLMVIKSGKQEEQRVKYVSGKIMTIHTSGGESRRGAQFQDEFDCLSFNPLRKVRKSCED